MHASDGDNPSIASRPRMPGIDDLMDRLRFSPAEGMIWLGDQRMLMIHAAALGNLRSELIQMVGETAARSLFTRMGHCAGAIDGAAARAMRPGSALEDMFLVGPQLHCLEGVVRVEPVRMELDIERGHYYGEFIWRGAVEDEEQIRHHGIGESPACWMQLGYANGYTSEFMGRPIIFREVECSSTGHDHCRIVGRPAEQWDGIESDLQLYRAEPFADGPAATALDEDGLIGTSAAFNRTCHLVRSVADTRVSVLFTGETGVGKERFGRAVHRLSPRRDGPFIAINCAALPEELVESELFGVERGAFTGAQQSRPGRFERADGGTLFLDEVGILSMAAQGKLLRVLQEGEVERVGGQTLRRVDVRIVAATNVDLRQAVAQGRFRDDLYFRLNVFPIRIPALRDRRADIPALINYFLHRFRERHRRSVAGFTNRAVSAMLDHSWPGNIREMENLIERAVILATPDGPIDVHHLFLDGEADLRDGFGIRADGNLRPLQWPGAVIDPDPTSGQRAVGGQVGLLHGGRRDTGVDAGQDLLDRVRDAWRADVRDPSAPFSLTAMEAALMTEAVEQASGNLSQAARSLGLTRAQLAYRLKHHVPAHGPGFRHGPAHCAPCPPTDLRRADECSS